MKDTEKSNFDQLNPTAKLPLFAELSSAEAEVTKGGMYCSQSPHRRRSYLMPSYFLNLVMFYFSSYLIGGNSEKTFSPTIVINNSFNSDNDTFINSEVGNGSVFSGGATKLA